MLLYRTTQMGRWYYSTLQASQSACSRSSLVTPQFRWVDGVARWEYWSLLT